MQSAPREPEYEFSAEGDQIPLADLPNRWEVAGYHVAESDDGSKIVFSKTVVVVEDRLVPESVMFQLHAGPGEPWMVGKVELREGVPQCVSLIFASGKTGREIRQADLRSVEINTLVIDLMSAVSVHVDQSDPDVTKFRVGWPGADGPGEVFTAARRFMERRRRRPGLREITPQLLERVAEVYRANISRAPTEAVAKAFGVKQRMASTYVQRARAAGYLPPTKQGKKQA